MNVAFDPWIPVVTVEGTRHRASLIEVFTEGRRFADLAVRPHERVALMRLFLCVAHAALDGPKDYDEWRAAPDALPGAASRYLESWRDSFELFHPTKPWLQVADLDVIAEDSSDETSDEKGWSPLRKICYTRASGNTPTLFDHSANGAGFETYSDDEIALNLLTFQNYFVAGGKAASRKWGNHVMLNPPNPKGGPCSGKSILYAFIREKDVKGTVIANLSDYDDLKRFYNGIFIGQPIWEYPIATPLDQGAIQNATQTHLGRLVPQTRILRLHEDRKKVLLGAGFLYPKFQDEKNPFLPDIYATVKTNSKDERELLSVRPGKALWRELHSIAVYKSADSQYARGPLCLKNVPETESCDLVVAAMVTNPNLAAEIVLLMESVFTIPARMRNEEGGNAYFQGVKSAELFANKLSWAIEGYREKIDGGWEGRLKSSGAKKGELKAKLHAAAARYYWTSVEKNLSLLMAHINAMGTEEFMPTQDAWRKMLYSTACDAYKTACGQETPRQMKAFSAGWRRLTSKDEDERSEGNEESKEGEA